MADSGMTAGDEATMVRLAGLRLDYPSGAGTVEVLRGIDLGVTAAETVSIVGPSGSGKSSMMMIVAGLERPTDGRVAVAGTDLAVGLGEIGTANDQGEYYLTDVVGLLAGRAEVGAIAAADPADVQGINSHDQLAEVSAEARRRILLELMESGVWVQDPARVYVDAGVEVAAGARLYPGVHLEGETKVAAGAVVGPDASKVVGGLLVLAVLL